MKTCLSCRHSEIELHPNSRAPEWAEFWCHAEDANATERWREKHGIEAYNIQRDSLWKARGYPDASTCPCFEPWAKRDDSGGAT